MLASQALAQEPLSPFERAGEAAPRSRLDELVLGRLNELGIEPAGCCSDAVFVRRAFLDVIGTLPTVEEARQFIASEDPDKRAQLIDRLLERPEYADYWALRWGDVLRLKAEFPINLWPNAAQAYHQWLVAAMRSNMPYDEFARTLLTASGSNFRVAPVNFYRATQSKEPEALAGVVALTFLGQRIENWSPESRAGLAAFFSRVGYKSTVEWKEEIVAYDPARGEPPGSPVEGVLPDGTKIKVPAGQDPRTVFADWLIRPDNDAFNQAIANRIWGWVQGQPIINEPDDIRPDNPPSHPELLAYLGDELAASGYDIKQLLRLILNSQTYQRSPVPRSTDPRALSLFASYPLRRLEAEVLIDAICAITGTSEAYESPIPEPFTFIPDNTRSIALPDGSISSSFLELFGKPSRDTGLQSERNNRPTAAQRLHLLNSTHIANKLRREGIRTTLTASRKPGEVVDLVYLRILSRFPTQQERATVLQYAQTGEAKGVEALYDVAWALINSPEFLYRH